MQVLFFKKEEREGVLQRRIEGKGLVGMPPPWREKKIKLPWAWDKHNLLDIEIISVNKLKMCYSFFDYLTLFYCTIIMLQVGTIPYN